MGKIKHTIWKNSKTTIQEPLAKPPFFFLKSALIWPSLHHLRLSSSCFPSCFPIKCLYAYPVFIHTC